MKLPSIRKKTPGEKFEKKLQKTCVDTHLQEKFQAMKDAGNLTNPPEPKQYAEERGCDNPDCPVHGKNKGKMEVPPPEVLEKMREVFSKIRPVENESCFYVTDGEHFFKCYESTDVEPLLVAFCTARGLEKDSFTVTQSTDDDKKGAVDILRNGTLRLVVDDEVLPVKFKTIRNDDNGFFVVLEK